MYSKLISFVLLGCSSMFTTSIVFSGCNSRREATLQMLSRNYTFSQKDQPIYITETDSNVNLSAGTADSFSLKFNTGSNLSRNEELVNIDGVIKVLTSPTETNGDQHLIATIYLTDSLTSYPSREREMTISVPVRELADSAHEVIVNYTGNQFTLYVDGRLYDNDFPVGTPSGGIHSATISNNITDVELHTPSLTAVRDNTTLTDIPQYWTPPYHNAWVGDVVACYHNGRYHIFYLFDRRGHSSKFGTGGHYFEHISSPDLVNWEEHEAAVPLDEQWETVGTGTPFVYNGELCLSYGLHTTRLFPYERTTLPIMKADFDSLDYTHSLCYDTIPALIPAGSTYSVSHDGGLTFEKSYKLFHHCENPSIFIDSVGNMMMYANYGARGTWQSDSLNGGWKCINAHFPPGGDCTFPCIVNNHDYVIGGFSGMWAKDAQAPLTEFKSIAKTGQDCYNGLSVPAVTTLPDGRIMMSGWIKMQNWGGALVTHEIISDGDDGTLGSRWVEELIPNVEQVSLSPTVAVSTPQSFISEFTLVTEEPGKGKATVDFGNGNLWTLSLDNDQAWFASSADETPRTLAEGGDVSTARNYAIPARVACKDKIPVRLIVYNRPKFNGSVIDVEIDGRRTMLSYRPELNVTEVTFKGDNISLEK